MNYNTGICKNCGHRVEIDKDGKCTHMATYYSTFNRGSNGIIRPRCDDCNCFNPEFEQKNILIKKE